MLDKRRHHATGSPQCTLILVAALTLSGCFFWLHVKTPNLTEFEDHGVISTPSYILIVPGNTTVLPTPYSLKQLPPDDESSLIDLRGFRFTINHEQVCNKSRPLLLMLIHSAPGNQVKRNVVRDTWGKRSKSVVVLFLVGRSRSDQHQQLLVDEDARYNDIVQGNFIDDYRNMTYKHVMALKWATYYCQSATYVLKLDDDVFVHMSGLMDFLRNSLSLWGARKLMLCDPMASSAVKRSWRSKWRVSPLEYPAKRYPSYCSGWAIMYSPDSVFLLYRAAQRERYFWIDDVHITGTLARKVNLTLASIHSLVLTNADLAEMLMEVPYEREFLFGPPNLSTDNIRALHEWVTAADYK